MQHPFQPCALTVRGLPRVVDKLLRRLGFDHALVVHVTDTTIVVTAWNDADEGEITLRTFQAPVLVAADDPSFAVDHGDVLELRHPDNDKPVKLPESNRLASCPVSSHLRTADES